MTERGRTLVAVLLTLLVVALMSGSAAESSLVGNASRAGQTNVAGVAPCFSAPISGGVHTESLSFVRGGDIFLASVNAGRVASVVREPHGTTPSSPAWSRDGRCLAFSLAGAYTGGDTFEHVLVRHSGSEIELRGGEGNHDESPSWAPDGRRLVLVGAQGSAGGGLYVERVGSEGSFELTPEFDSGPGTSDNMPAWAPDGSTISFTRARLSTPTSETRILGLYLIRPNGNGLRRITPLPAANPSWSPDSKQLVFDDGRRIAIINSNGSGLRYLTPSRGVAVDPAWSPDGHTIAYVRYSSAADALDSFSYRKPGDIWLMDSIGHNQRLLTRKGSQPAWKAL